MKWHDFIGNYTDFIGKKSVNIEGEIFGAKGDGFKEWELEHIIVENLDKLLKIGEMREYVFGDNVNCTITFFKTLDIYLAYNDYDDTISTYETKEDMFEDVLSEYSIKELILGTSGEAKEWVKDTYFAGKPEGFYAEISDTDEYVYLVYPEIRSTTPDPAFIISGIYKDESGNIWEVAWNNTNVKETDFPTAEKINTKEV